MSTDWYRRHLNPPPQQQQAPARPAPYPHYQRPGAPTAPPQQPPMQVPHQPPHQQPQGPAPGQEREQYVDENGQMHVGDAILMWKGNPKGGAAERASCPKCGSNQFFSRAGQSITKADGTRVTPAPRCAQCGHNGLFEQFGDLYDSNGNRVG